MVDRATFSRYVKEAFSHIDDRPYLRSHPLTKLLVATDEPGAPEALRRTLVRAIEELRPPEPVPARSHWWRRHRYLRLRYIEGIEPEQIARELMLSPRQCRREHWQAVEAVASILWEQYGQEAVAERERQARPPASGESDGAAENTGVTLEEELTRAAAEQPREPTSTHEVLGGVFRTVASLANSQDAEVGLAVDGELAPVAVQRIALRQMLLSLLSYALGLARRTRVDVAAANVAQAVEVRITARRLGRGGQQVDLSPHQVVAAAEIAVARRLAELQGAALRVEVPDGDTVSFHLTLPGAQSSSVLVVDDNPDVARLFQRYLAGTSYRLIQARTGAGALRLAQEDRPDVIVLDVLLPSEDGWEVLEALKSNPGTRDIPVVVCSVLPDRMLALSLGVVDFLPKPVTQSALLAALERCREAASPGGSRGRSSRNA